MLGTKAGVEKRQAPVYEQMDRIAPDGEFVYLGRTMIVMRREYMTSAGPFPLMTCHYVDDHGVIREHSFGSQDLDTLEKYAKPTRKASLGADQMSTGTISDSDVREAMSSRRAKDTQR
tara:strand:- start:2228 stop:2581 length:354 start_codon:yes stop_codon:yes gene_type:complete